MLNLLFTKTSKQLQLATSFWRLLLRKEVPDPLILMKKVIWQMREMQLTIHMERAVIQFHKDDNPPSCNKSNLLIATYKKDQEISSNKHGLSAISRGMTATTAAHDTRFERQLPGNRKRKKLTLDLC